MAPCAAFQSVDQPTSTTTSRVNTQLSAAMDRRNFGQAMAGAAAFGLLGGTSGSAPANAEVFFDPAMYGDQELRVGTVDTVRERARRAILQNPALAPSFYQLALLDGLSFNVKDQGFGPNGNVIYAVLNTKDSSPYIQNLQLAAAVLIQAEKDLKRKTAVSIADCVAIAGAEAIESIGGPVLPVQLGRMDLEKGAAPAISPLSLDILSGKKSPQEVRDAFAQAGITEREMTALLMGLLTLERVEKTRTVDDWKQSAKPKYVERGKMGRVSDYKRLTDEDIKAAEEDEYDEDPDDGWYIAESFGTRDDRFGARIAKDDLNEKNFNKYIKELNTFYIKGQGDDVYGWIGKQMVDPSSPTSQAWMKRYSDSNLSYTKDLGVSFNAITQLGAVYTGGKYENLLKKGPRKSLNDGDLNLF
jgi:hypothetical protein